MLETGFMVFLGVALILWKLPRLLMLRLLDYPLAIRRAFGLGTHLALAERAKEAISLTHYGCPFGQTGNS
jgi:hypothetical protein